MRTRNIAVTSLTILFLAACGEAEVPEEQSPAPGVGAADQSAGGMADMPARDDMQDQGGMMAGMAAHMQMMNAMSGDSMRAMLPAHRQRVANMIAQMNREMRDMNMTGDEKWTATVDSLRRDLTRMPEMTAGELHAIMPRHHARMMRLMEMHRDMMGNMQM